MNKFWVKLVKLQFKCLRAWLAKDRGVIGWSVVGVWLAGMCSGCDRLECDRGVIGWSVVGVWLAGVSSGCDSLGCDRVLICCGEIRCDLLSQHPLSRDICEATGREEVSDSLKITYNKHFLLCLTQLHNYVSRLVQPNFATHSIQPIRMSHQRDSQGKCTCQISCIHLW